jgi:hypothetical protein
MRHSGCCDRHCNCQCGTGHLRHGCTQAARRICSRTCCVAKCCGGQAWGTPVWGCSGRPAVTVAPLTISCWALPVLLNKVSAPPNRDDVSQLHELSTRDGKRHHGLGLPQTFHWQKTRHHHSRITSSQQSLSPGHTGVVRATFCRTVYAKLISRSDSCKLLTDLAS